MYPYALFRLRVSSISKIAAIVVIIALSLVTVFLYVTYFTRNGTVTTQTVTTYSVVKFSGNMITSGKGTRVTQATFASSVGFYVANLSSEQYSVSLGVHSTYKVSISWVGNYSWQGGTYVTYFAVPNNVTSANLSQNFSVPTPASKVGVFGSIHSSGNGTYPNQITFGGSHGEAIAQTINKSSGNYLVEVPNQERYSVSVTWIGLYSWQTGSPVVGTVDLTQNKNGSISKNWQISTPDSILTLSGKVTTTGNGTIPKKITFTASGTAFSTNVINGSYTLSIGNEAQYTTLVSWTGEFTWQSGTSQAGTLSLNQSPNSTRTPKANLTAPTPNSEVNVSGIISTTGSGTKPVSLSYSGPTVNSGLSLVNGTYSIILPNLAKYNVSISWIGTYSWQSGYSSAQTFQLTAGPGVQHVSQNWAVRTPNSLVKVSGTVNVVSGTPYQITFKSYNGQVFQSVNVPGSGSSYSISLPNQAIYAVTIYFTNNGKVVTCNPGTLTVNETAFGPSEITDNLQC